MMNLVNPQYKEDVAKYQKKDAIVAICFWAGLMILYAAAGVVSKFVPLIPSIVITIVLLAVCAFIVLRKGGKISSIGFRRTNVLPSLGLGLMCAIVPLVLVNGILPALIYGWKLEPIGYLLYQFFYILVAIALVEEVLFRGYIQTRLYGLFKGNISSVLIGALLFMLMHIPFQLAYTGVGIFSQMFFMNLAFTFIFHIVLNLIYVKYNVIYGAILLHTLNNWIYDIFSRDHTPMWSIYIYYGVIVLTLAILGIRYWYLRRHPNLPENDKN